jgi:putative phage-type endonuclease
VIEQRTDDWFKVRLGKATASRFNDIMKGERLAGWKNYRSELAAERLTGQALDNYTSGPMQWGIDNEPLARLLYTLSTGNQVEECGFFEHDSLAAGASPDGLIGNNMTIEIKCPNTATHIETLRSGKVPTQYIAQVQGQLWITKRKRADFVSFDPRLPDNARIIIIPVQRDETYIQQLESFITTFLQQVDDECDFIQNYQGGKREQRNQNRTSNTSKMPVRPAKNVVPRA